MNQPAGILHDWRAFPRELRGGVLCIGNFDGVHVGHAQMLETGLTLARRTQSSFSIMTFDPHPSAILRPDSPRPPLSTPAQRLELLATFSPDALIVVPTTRDFLAMPAETFLAEVVRDTIGAKRVVEGPTFTFGRGAKGNGEMLRQRGGEFGFAATIVPAAEVTLSDLLVTTVSSSLIRWLVERGRVADAAMGLGRPFALRGTVVEGQKRGRTIGFPTANVQTGQLIPAPGVYAGAAVVEGARHRAAISVGNNPTFAGKTTTVEAFLLDFSGDLYGKTVDVEFHRYLREMIAFGGVEQLVRQMNRDVAATREMVV